MKHLYIIVEGQTELEFVNKLLIPYLLPQLPTHIQAIQVSISGGGHGYNNVQHFKNTIKPVLNYTNEPVITTMLDYFGINSEQKMPGYARCMQLNSTDDKIACLEQSLQEQVQSIKPYRFFIPYIQKHEMETLLFANPETFDLVSDEVLVSDSIKQAVIAVCEQYPNIEEINNTPEGAPSKRLEAIFNANNQTYNKVVDAVDIAQLTGIETILTKCPRFNNWVQTLIQTISET